MRADRVEWYKDAEGKFRWRFVRSNGAILADSGQGYVRKSAARDAAWYVVNGWGMTSSPMTFWVKQE